MAVSSTKPSDDNVYIRAQSKEYLIGKQQQRHCKPKLLKFTHATASRFFEPRIYQNLSLLNFTLVTTSWRFEPHTYENPKTCPAVNTPFNGSRNAISLN